MTGVKKSKEDYLAIYGKDGQIQLRKKENGTLIGLYPNFSMYYSKKDTMPHDVKIDENWGNLHNRS